MSVDLYLLWEGAVGGIRCLTTTTSSSRGWLGQELRILALVLQSGSSIRKGKRTQP